MINVLSVFGAGNISDILKAAREAMGSWGTIIVGILGVAALIVAAYQIVSGLISHGKKQTSWLVVIALLIVGGLFTTWALSDVAFLGGENSDIGQIVDGTNPAGTGGNQWSFGDGGGN